MALEDLVPGMRVKAVVAAVAGKGGGAVLPGLYAKLALPAGPISGGLDYVHAAGRELEVGDAVTAVVLVVDAAKGDAAVTFSLREELYVGATLGADLSVRSGDFIERARVVRVDPAGVALEAGGEDDDGETAGPRGDTPAKHRLQMYAPVAQLADDRVSAGKGVARLFKVGDVKRCRVLGFSLIDRLAMVSLRPSVLSQPVLRYDEIRPGNRYEVTAKAFVDSGALLVELVRGVTGIIPELHLADARLRRPHEKFKPGTVLSVRAILVEPKRKYAVFSAKKSLVDDRLPPLVSWEQAAADGPKSKFTGVVRAVSPAPGLVVAFYADVRGFLPLAELGIPSLRTKEDLEKMFPVGKTIAVHVAACRPADRKLRLTLSEAPSKLELYKPAADAAPPPPPGTLLSGKVAQVDDDEICVTAGPGSGFEGANVFIPLLHLSDFAGLTSRFKRVLAAPAAVENLLVLAQLKSGKVVGSLKPLLASASKAGTLLRNEKDAARAMAEGEVVVGYVKSVLASGAVIGFGGSFAGFVRKASVADRFVSDAQECLSVGQSVLAVVETVESSKKVFLSLKESDIKEKQKKAAAQRSKSYFAELRKLADLEEALASTQNRSTYRVGEVVKASVIHERPYGLVLGIRGDSQNTFSGVVITPHIGPKRPEVGQDVEAVVLEVDYESDIVHLSLKPELVVAFAAMKKSSKKKSSSKQSAKDAPKKFEGSVELVKDEHVLITSSKVNGFVYSHMGKLNEDLSKKKKNLGVVSGSKVVCGKVSDTSHFPVTQVKSVEKPAKSKKEQPPTQTREDIEKKIVVGNEIEGRVVKVQPSRLVVALGPGFVGYLHITDMPETPSTKNADAPTENPLKKYAVGGKITAKVKSVVMEQDEDDQDHHNVRKVELSMRSGSVSEVAEYNQGQIITGYAQKAIGKEILLVSVTPKIMGRIRDLNSTRDFELLKSGPFSAYKAGVPVRCRVLNSASSTPLERLELSLNLGENAKPKTLCAKVIRVDPTQGLKVSTPSDTGYKFKYATLSVTDISDDFETAAKLINGEEESLQGRFIECAIVDSASEHLYLSMRKSALPGAKAETIRDRDISDWSQLKLGEKIRGFVRSASKQGIFLNVGRNITARILLSNASDVYISDPSTSFIPGSLVEGWITAVDIDKERLDMTLKSGKDKKAKSLEDLVEGSVIQANVKSIQAFGVFLSFLGLSGLCHKSEVSDEPFEDLTSAVPAVGTPVKAVILAVDTERKRISLSMKKSHIEAASFGEAMDESSEEDDADVADDADDADEEMAEASGSDDEEPVAMSKANEVDESSAEESFDTDDVPEEPAVKKAGLKVDGGFVFEDDDEDMLQNIPSTAGAAAHDDGHSSDSDGQTAGAGEKGKKSSKEKREKKRAKIEMEREIRNKEEALASSLDTPRTADDFERLLLATPNASLVWLRFMAFHLSLSEMGKARALAERALKRIPPSEERERFNLWLGYINLEAHYGNEGTFRTLFERACLNTNDKELHLKALLALRSKSEIAGYIASRALKKFRGSKKVWIAIGELRFGNHELGTARKVLRDALAVLPKHKHLAVISKFAQLEYKTGSRERGRTMFEGIVGNFPKRVDLWSVYLDMEIRWLRLHREAAAGEGKAGEEEDAASVAGIRRLFERCCALGFLSTKKMRFFLKRFLEFEKAFGDESGVEAVKERAREYVSAKME